MAKMLKVIRVQGGTILFDMRRSRLDRFAELMRKIAEKISHNENETTDFRPFSCEIAKEFDQAFGCGATVKTFGVSAPSLLQWEEFWDKFGVLLDKWVREV